MEFCYYHGNFDSYGIHSYCNLLCKTRGISRFMAIPSVDNNHPNGSYVHSNLPLCHWRIFHKEIRPRFVNCENPCIHSEVFHFYNQNSTKLTYN